MFEHYFSLDCSPAPPRHDVVQAFESPSALAAKKLGNMTRRRSLSPSRRRRTRPTPYENKEEAEFFQNLRESSGVSLSPRRRRKSASAEGSSGSTRLSSRGKAIAEALSLVSKHHKSDSLSSSSARSKMTQETKEESNGTIATVGTEDEKNSPDAFDLAVRSFSWELPASTGEQDGVGQEAEVDEGKGDFGRMWELASAIARDRQAKSADSNLSAAGATPYPLRRGQQSFSGNDEVSRGESHAYSEITLRASNTSLRSHNPKKPSSIVGCGAFSS